MNETDICPTDRTIMGIFSGALTAESMERAEAELLKQPQAEAPLIHRFGPGIYIREVFLPKGTICIGHYQKTEHLNIMLKGRVLMLNGSGKVQEVKAPTIFTGKPGRKVGIIYEDVVWLNVYATTETDIEKLEEMFLIKSDSWKEDNDLKKSIRELEHERDRKDYANLLEEFGLTEKLVREQTENEGDQIPFPYGGYTVRIDDSPIQGKGLFASAPIETGQEICPALIKGKRTPAGRYCNHSADPNAIMKLLDNGDIVVVAVKKINGNTGGHNGDEITTDYRTTIKLGGKPCHQSRQ